MLTGKDISPVQFYANIILDAISEVEKVSGKDRELRLAILASGTHSDPASLFDEIQSVEILTDEDEISADEDEVRYDFSSTAEVDQAKVEEEIRNMLAMAAEGETSFEPTTTDWI